MGETLNVVFLDYDGVVNTPMWELRDGKWKYRHHQTYDGKVNNQQAVQWVSEFCEKYGYDISTGKGAAGMAALGVINTFDNKLSHIFREFFSFHFT